MTISIAIPAYRNADRLARCLDSIILHAPELIDRTVVVDDSGTAEVAQSLKARYPKVKWIAHTTNLGFGASANEAVLASISDIVILLNDDVRLLNNPCNQLEASFKNESLFAVTFRSQSSQGKFREGAKRLVWRFGFPKILHNPKDQVMKDDVEQPSAYAVGGHCAYRREYFEKLGGFDPLFEPFYWEDVDLSMRAALRGWTISYLPTCHVVHEETGAIKSSRRQDEIRVLTLRNRILFARRHCPKTCRLPLKINLAVQKTGTLLRKNALLKDAFKEAEMLQREMTIQSTHKDTWSSE